MKKKKRLLLTDGQLTTIVAIIVALIGCFGTAFAAIISYMSISMQIEKPISFTQTVEAIMTSSQTPLLTPQNTPEAPLPDTLTPTSTLTPSLISASRVGDRCETKILPDYIRPYEGVERAIAQIAEAETRGEEFSLSPDFIASGDTVLAGNSLSQKIEFRNEVQTIDWLKLSNSIKVTVKSDDNVREKVDMWVVSGCGGGEYRYFSPEIGLETNYPTYSVDVVNSEFDFFTLQPGEFEAFDFNFFCKSPGIYTINIELPYSLFDMLNTFSYTVTTKIICPKNLTVWYSYYAGMLEYGGEFFWNGVEYVPIK